MIKKVLAAGLATVMMLSMTGCGGGGSSSTTSGQNTQAADADTQAAGGGGGNADMPKLTMSIGHNGNMDSLNQYVAEQVKALLEERSSGNITVNIYPNAQLGSESDMLTSC